jgi:hypothetical protein
MAQRTKMNSSEFKEFISHSSDPHGSGPERRLSFAGVIPYNELNYAPGSMGYHQVMDRVEFTIENWHSHVCSHPVFKNPDPELDSVRSTLVEAAQSLFEVYNALGSLQFKRGFEEPTTSYNKLGVH